MNVPWHNKKNWIHWFLKERSENIIETIHCLLSVQWKQTENQTQFFEGGQWQHVENHIHCLVKQQ